jgi:hypothetical protein
MSSHYGFKEVPARVERHPPLANIGLTHDPVHVPPSGSQVPDISTLFTLVSEIATRMSAFEQRTIGEASVKTDQGSFSSESDHGYEEVLEDFYPPPLPPPREDISLDDASSGD